MSKQLYLDAIEERDEELRLARERIFNKGNIMNKEKPEVKDNGPVMSMKNVDGKFEESIVFTFLNEGAQTKIESSVENMGYAIGQLLIAMSEATGKDESFLCEAIVNSNKAMAEKGN